MPPPTTRRQLLAAGAAAPFAASFLGHARASTVSGRLKAKKLSAVGDLLDSLVSNGQIAGGSARVAVNGKTLFERHAGKADLATGQPITPDTIYRIYSMTKPVTAAAIMALVDDGKLSLSDPVERFVPEFKNLAVYVGEENGKALTEPAATMHIGDLLTHTSGISNSWNPGPIAPIYRKLGLNAGQFIHDPDIKGLPDVAARMAQAPLQFQPGSKWLYSFSPDIAGLVVERASEMGFGGYLKARIFDPLGMTDTDFYVPAEKAGRLASMYALKDGALVLAEAAQGSPFLNKPSAESGAAGLMSTLGDYGKFASMLARRGALGGERILRESTATNMMSNHVSPDVLGQSLSRFMAFGAGGAGGGMGFGLCGAVLLDPELSDKPGVKGEYTWGGAASTTFFVVPDLGLDAVLMTQLFPSGTLPLLDMLKTAVYSAMG
ncbi:MAG: serine hydrolase domain-containing protein [Pseudomonadota bacterium]|nr:serine hydrolase domain-containing protein [Pseudomonadota bacterium]